MIVEHIGVPALLEQLAEECCELAQASLKMARKLRDENPTPKSIEDIRENLVEEIADVEACVVILCDETNIVDPADKNILSQEKTERWQKRLEQHIGFDFDELSFKYDHDNPMNILGRGRIEKHNEGVTVYIEK